MKIAIVGSGNVAFHLAKALHESEVENVVLMGRNQTDLEKISGESGYPFFLDFQK